MIIVPSLLGSRCPEGADDGEFNVLQKPTRTTQINIESCRMKIALVSEDKIDKRFPACVHDFVPKEETFL